MVMTMRKVVIRRGDGDVEDGGDSFLNILLMGVWQAQQVVVYGHEDEDGGDEEGAMVMRRMVVMMLDILWMGVWQAQQVVDVGRDDEDGGNRENGDSDGGCDADDGGCDDGLVVIVAMTTMMMMSMAVTVTNNVFQEGKIAGRAVLIAGPPGTGKTAIAMGNAFIVLPYATPSYPLACLLQSEGAPTGSWACELVS